MTEAKKVTEPGTPELEEQLQAAKAKAEEAQKPKASTPKAVGKMSASEVEAIALATSEANRRQGLKKLSR